MAFSRGCSVPSVNTDASCLCAVEVKAEPSAGNKRRSPVQPPMQPAAKKGRLIRQKSSPHRAQAAGTDSDDPMEECVSPSTVRKRHAVESDDDEDYVAPGQVQSSRMLCCMPEHLVVLHDCATRFGVDMAYKPHKVHMLAINHAQGLHFTCLQSILLLMTDI